MKRIDYFSNQAYKDLSQGEFPFLEKRLHHLEESKRFTLDALDTAASLGDFQSSINKLQDSSIILEETRKRICDLIPFEATSIFLVDGDDGDFILKTSEPKNFRTFIKNEIDFLTENGSFALTLRGRSPSFFSTRNFKRKIILHTMATTSKIRGMFVGLLRSNVDTIPDVSLSLLSIILLNSSNAIESLELYSRIKKINENLERSENYRILFETAPDGVELTGSDGHIIDCNRALASLLGYEAGKIIGNHTADFVSDESRKNLEHKMNILRERGYMETELTLIRCDGTKIPVLKRGQAIYDEKKNLLGYVLYNRDLTAQKESEEEQKKLQHQLQRAQKMEALGTLAGGVAHDLNNILVGLVSYPELLLMQIPSDNPLRKSIETIQRSGEKAAAIVQDLLTLARRGVAAKEAVNLNTIISDFLKTPEYERLKFRHQDIRFEVIPDNSLLNIVGSPVHLSKTLMNLVSNAAEAMPCGGTLILSTRNAYIDRPVRGYDTVNEGDYAILQVSDSGTGIAPNDLDRIFEPFYTKKKMGNSGTGLGLAVVWGTTKDHEGYIDVQSSKEEGTTFTLYFPASRSKTFETVPPVHIDYYRGNGERVLVVDDIEEQREIAQSILENLGYKVNVASNGNDALKLLKKHKPDIVILDMIMSQGMDGLDTYKHIKEIEPEQKAIIVSGFSEDKRVREAQILGAGAYVRKPYLIEKIGTAVRKELDR